MPSRQLRRHDLLRILPDQWAAAIGVLGSLDQLSDETRQLIESWATRGWPVIVRRRGAEDVGQGIAVGLPLTPALGKLRLGFTVPVEHVSEYLAPLSLSETVETAPASLRPQLRRVIELGEQLSVPPEVFGGLLWQHLTGLPYLHAGSDIDLLWPAPSEIILTPLLAGLAELDADGPARLDGEIVLPTGAGVNWRELHQQAPGLNGAVLVKSMDGAGLRCVNNLFA